MLLNISNRKGQKSSFSVDTQETLAEALLTEAHKALESFTEANLNTYREIYHSRDNKKCVQEAVSEFVTKQSKVLVSLLNKAKRTLNNSVTSTESMNKIALESYQTTQVANILSSELLSDKVSDVCVEGSFNTHRSMNIYMQTPEEDYYLIESLQGPTYSEFDAGMIKDNFARAMDFVSNYKNYVAYESSILNNIEAKVYRLDKTHPRSQKELTDLLVEAVNHITKYKDIDNEVKCFHNDFITNNSRFYRVAYEAIEGGVF